MKPHDWIYVSMYLKLEHQLVEAKARAKKETATISGNGNSHKQLKKLVRFQLATLFRHTWRSQVYLHPMNFVRLSGSGECVAILYMYMLCHLIQYILFTYHVHHTTV